MRKNIVLTFLFSLFPGAGQMYLGYTKRGTSLMLLFMGLCGIIFSLELSILSVLLPVIWFFAFFDSWNIRRMDQAQRIACPDDFLPHGVLPTNSSQQFLRRYHTALGVGLVLLGVYLFYDILLLPLLAQFLNSLSTDFTWLWRLAKRLPTLVVALLLILLGVRLVRRTPAVDTDEEWQYKGEE